MNNNKEIFWNIFENKKVVSGPRDYQENVRRSRKCRVDLIFYVSRHKK